MARKTGVQENGAYNSTDDFITRTYVLPILLDKKRRAAIIKEHAGNPVGTPGKAGHAGIGHSEDLQRVVDKFRRAPMKGKYVRVCIEPHKGPARACVQVAALPKGARVEIDCVAWLGS